jgi:hypothetical protein
MRHRFLNLLTVLSLLACVAVAVLWPRSYLVRDSVYWGNLRLPGEAAGSRSILVESNHGGLYVGRHPRSRSQGLFWDCFAPNDLPLSGGSHVALGVWIKRQPIHPGDTSVGVRLPFWLLLALAAIAPACRKWSALRRHRPGLCPACGYDRHATPGRCPECGHVTIVASDEAAAQS